MLDGVEVRKAEFRASLATDIGTSQIVQRYMLHGECVAITEDQHFELKRKIAEAYSLEVNQEVFVVGSAKLGFSIAPHKRYADFHDRSDVDVAIVSRGLFESVWHQVHTYSEGGGFWEKQPQYRKYLERGWIRPDLLPKGDGFPFTQEWLEFFMGLRRSGEFGPFKIAAGIYYDIRFLESYQERSVAKCREDIQE